MLKLSTGFRNLQAGVGIDNFSLVTNGLFTSNVTGWTAGGAAVVTHYGTDEAMKIVDGGGGNGWVDNDAAITVRKGQVYLCSLDIKAVSGTPSVTIYIRDTTNGGGTIYDERTVITAAAGYTTYELLFRVPVAASTTDLFIQTKVINAAGEVYVDNVGLARFGSSFKEVFKDCFLELRSGTQPPTADDVPTGSLVCSFYSDGTALGLEFGEAVLGIVGKKTTETWSGTALITETVGWFRLKNINDTGTTNTVDARIDGSVGLTGGPEDLLMPTNQLSVGEVHTIGTFKFPYVAS